MRDSRQPSTNAIADSASPPSQSLFSLRAPATWTRTFSAPMQMTLDGMVMILAFSLAYLLRFDFTPSLNTMRGALFQLPAVLLFQFLALNFCGGYRFIWRYISLLEIPTFLRASFYSSIPLFFMRLLLPAALSELRMPFSVIILNAGLMFAGIIGLRILRRFLYERYERRSIGPLSCPTQPPRNVLLIGAGRAGVTAAREIRSRPDMNMNLLGFLDDDRSKAGSVIQGLRVLGDTSRILDLTRKLDVKEVIITIANASHGQLRHIIDYCEKARIKMRIIPALQEILDGRLRIDSIRDVQIEDLLGRDQVFLNQDALRKFIQNQIVLITGSGGSIGSELARQVAAHKPQRLLLIERAEFALYEIDREIRRLYPDVPISPLLADIGDSARIDSILKGYRPHIVFHAAAHKHVPLMEQNAMEAVKNNIVATHQLGKAAGAAEVASFVLISSDKAVNPTSVMGATKRAAELVIQDLDQQFKTKFLAVRFGNVLGSAGSVIPLFREQIMTGGPVTVTHPDMVRYFMTIPEAVSLVLQAGAMGNGGEVFVLDMGEPVRVMDLAAEMIRLSGLTPGKDIQIAITGMRPGEKLREELQTDQERVIKTSHPKIFIGRITPATDGLVAAMIERLSGLVCEDNDASLRNFLNEILPEATLSLSKTNTLNVAPIVKSPAPRSASTVAAS